jgi:hypothetical protein
VRPVIGPPNLLRDPLGALFFVARPAVEALFLDARRALEEDSPLLRAEVLRERLVVEPLLRGLPPEPLLPLRLTFVCAICPPRSDLSVDQFPPSERGDSGYRHVAPLGPAPLPTARRYHSGR